MSKRCYSELIRLETFEDRFDYLKLFGVVGEETFGFDRYLNQMFYASGIWLEARDFVISRDLGYDLGIYGADIDGPIIVHHMNPIKKEDIIMSNPDLINPEFLICVSSKTHRFLHYGIQENRPKIVIERTPFDTCPWRKGGV